MSASDNDSISLHSGPSSPLSPWDSQSDSQSESELLMNSNYEMIQPEIEYEVDGTVSSVNSEDLDQEWEHFRSPSPRSPMIPQQLLSTHASEIADDRSSVDGEEEDSKLFGLEHSTSSSSITRFTDSSQDGSDTTLDSLATLCLPYTFPDPTHNPDSTDNKLSDLSTQTWTASEVCSDTDPFHEHDSFTLDDRTASEVGGMLYEGSPIRSSYSTHSSHWPNLCTSDGPPSLSGIHSPDLNTTGLELDVSSHPQVACTSRSSNMAPVTSPALLSDSITAFHELHIYLLGKPMPRCEIRTLFNKLRTNLIAHPTLQALVLQQQSDNQHRCTKAVIGLPDLYRTVIAHSLGSTSQPAHRQSLRQTSDLEIILHDLTRLSEEGAYLHAASLPARPALVIYRVDPSTFVMPHWLPPLLLSRRGSDNLMTLMLISDLPSKPDLNISVDLGSAQNSQSSEKCVDALETDYADLSHQILRCTDSQGSPSSMIIDLNDLDMLSSPSVAQLRRMMVPVQSPKPTLLKSIILSTAVLVISTMLMSWFTLHSSQSMPSTSLLSACQAHSIFDRLVPTLRSSCSIDSLSSINDSMLPEPAQQVNSLRTDVMPISKEVLPDPNQGMAHKHINPKSKSEQSLPKSPSETTESKFPSSLDDYECSMAASSSQCKEGAKGEAKSDKVTRETSSGVIGPKYDQTI
ncbi:hypothetical protein DFH28DRAFT_161704 [Melampsora americana]|nr:hypothetical protein DFH28DRAFT_161704 [Melampsora americana]